MIQHSAAVCWASMNWILVRAQEEGLKLLTTDRLSSAIHSRSPYTSYESRRTGVDTLKGSVEPIRRPPPGFPKPG